MQVDSCRLCSRGKTYVSLRLNHAPRDIMHLLKQSQLQADRPTDVEVRTCGSCGFVQINPVLEERYYDEYLMATTHSRQMQEVQRNQAKNFIERFSLSQKRILEAGCGDGSFSSHLKSFGAHVFGIEPSRRMREIAASRGHSVEEGYLTAERKLAEGPFDAFVTRQVLEHVPDIHDFLTGLRRNLKLEGVGLIEVPRLEKALSDLRFYDFFTDHVNYFSVATLELAVRMNGFDAVDTFPDMNDEYNVILVRAVQHPDLAPVQAESARLASQLQLIVEQYISAGKKIAIWGAGGKGLTVLAVSNLRDVSALFDSDVAKQGLYTPVSHLLVEAPSIGRLKDIDAVVVTAMAYHKEIEVQLRSELSYRGKILFLSPQLN